MAAFKHFRSDFPDARFLALPMALIVMTTLVCLGGLHILNRLDQAFPPPLDQPTDRSVEVLDRNGLPLHIFTTSQGRWRLETDLTSVDPQFIKMLIAYEDKRFHDHGGVDILALLRSAAQFVANGRIVSGGSTVTMQLARLMEPRNERSLGAKLWQIIRAVQIERRQTKQQIMKRYLTLAPYGGNIEGIRAASLSWFGKEPQRLGLEESALLVALPQSPERRRPDRFPVTAKLARDRVLQRLVSADMLPDAEASRVARIAVPHARQKMPHLALHLARKALDRDPLARLHKTRLDQAIQHTLEKLARDSARQLGKRVSIAIVVADSRSGDILASVGSSGISDTNRMGWIDMTQASRSPGSTLKPFVYGLAIEDGLVRPASMIADRPSDFNGYRPRNFDMTYQGEVSVRRALQMSLNVPAVRLLKAVTPVRFVARLKRAGIQLELPGGKRPGLSVVLGGVGVSLTDLVQLYVNLIPGRNHPIAIGDGVHKVPGKLNGRRPLSNIAAWHVVDMLSGMPEPVGSSPLALAYKTGTSYGYRDAWSIGFDGRHVIGVWVGRADNGPVPGITGTKTAAPILFEAFQKSGLVLVLPPRAPDGALRESAAELPVSLKYFEDADLDQRFVNIAKADRLHITFPGDGQDLEVSKFSDGSVAPVPVKLQGGVPPFRLLENQYPLKTAFRKRQIFWTPQSRGITTLSVIDALGQSRSINIRVY